MRHPEIDEPAACEMCRGTGVVAIGPWGVRPPKVTCPECGGDGWRLKLVGEIRTLAYEIRWADAHTDVGQICGAGGNVEVAVEARLAYDRDHQLASVWLRAEDQLTASQYDQYRQLYAERRHA